MVRKEIRVSFGQTKDENTKAAVKSFNFPCLLQQGYFLRCPRSVSISRGSAFRPEQLVQRGETRDSLLGACGQPRDPDLLATAFIIKVPVGNSRDTSYLNADDPRKL